MKKLFTICLCGLMAASTIACSDDGDDLSLEDFCKKNTQCTNGPEDGVGLCMKTHQAYLESKCGNAYQSMMKCKYDLTCKDFNNADTLCPSETKALNECLAANAAEVTAQK